MNKFVKVCLLISFCFLSNALRASEFDDVDLVGSLSDKAGALEQDVFLCLQEGLALHKAACSPIDYEKMKLVNMVVHQKNLQKQAMFLQSLASIMAAYEGEGPAYESLQSYIATKQEEVAAYQMGTAHMLVAKPRAGRTLLGDAEGDDA